MNEEIRKRIIDWIYVNHEHHEGAGGSVATIDLDAGTMSEFEDEGPTSLCADGNSPYVNSLELEKFIKEL